LRKRRDLQVSIPRPDEEKPRWARVGIFAVVGLAVGLAWPTLAGVRVGPDLPGAKDEPAPDPAPGAPSASASTAPALAKPAPAPARSNTQSVVVAGGEIASCYEGKDKLDRCGSLKIDPVLVPRLQQLEGCASAIGLAGEVEIGFDLRFDTKEIRLIEGKKGDLPRSTVQGVITCAADYIRDVEPDKIPHKHSRYRVFYLLKFYPPGSAPPTAGAEQEESAAGDDGAQRGLGTVSWDTALARSEPRTGKVVMRLVRGTRVHLLGRRKDWYRVKVGTREGWVYRGALGL
jgi:hypothetical protein